MGIFKDKATILTILFNNPAYVSGQVLADFNNTGLKTLRKEIDLLNEYCRDYGFEVISKVGIGYMLDIKDNEKYQSFRNYVESKFYNGYYYDNAQHERVHYLTRLLLVKNDVLMQELVEKCNYSESSIRRDLQFVREELAEFDLQLLNKSNKGLSVIGKEWNKRLAIINEELIYHRFEKVYFTEKEAFDDILLFNTTRRRDTYGAMKKVFGVNRYPLSYIGLIYLADLILLCYANNNADSLEQNKYIEKLELTEEKEIINAIFEEIKWMSGFKPSEKEALYLAAFLHSQKGLNFHEFVKLDIAPKIEKIVKDFFAYAESFYDLSSYDTSILYKDLCCEIARMYYYTNIGFHTSSTLIDHFINDGLMNLDLCALLYNFIRATTDIKCNPSDIVMFYYCFSYFNKTAEERNKKKIGVVSNTGYFNSRAIANQYQRLTDTNEVQFVPFEYSALAGINEGELCGIITDIARLKYEYPNMIVVDSFFVRKRNEMNDVVNYILYNSTKVKEAIFSRENIHYVDHFDNFKEIENYIRENILLENEDKDKFFKSFYLKDEIYRTRRNNLLIVNTIDDHLNRSFLDIIYINDFLEYEGGAINKVIIYNAKGNTYLEKNKYARILSKLLHAYNFVFSGDIDVDMEMIEKIIFS